MPRQHKTGPESCQAALAAMNPIPLRTASISLESGWAAVLCRREAMTSVLLFASTIASPDLVAGSSDKGPGSLRTEDHVHVTTHRAGDAILVTLRIDAGYHVNANPASNEYLIPTSIAFDGVIPERIAYPPGTPFNPAFAVEPIDVYEDTVTIAATFPPGTLDQAHDLRFTLTAQACTTQICLPPDDISGRATW